MSSSPYASLPCTPFELDVYSSGLSYPSEILSDVDDMFSLFVDDGQALCNDGAYPCLPQESMSTPSHHYLADTPEPSSPSSLNFSDSEVGSLNSSPSFGYWWV